MDERSRLEEADKCSALGCWMERLGGGIYKARSLALSPHYTATDGDGKEE